MKKLFAAFMSCLVVGMILAGAFGVLAAGSPNYGYSSGSGNSYTGYVQCQSSYVENGYHAARGMLKYEFYDGYEWRSTGWKYTDFGYGPTDTNIHSRTFNLSCPTTTVKPAFRYDFDWVAHGSSVWPVSVPDEVVTE